RCAVFAKTDLIHAQQEGYSVGQISDGLCEGLAKNVIDTLMPDQEVRTPLVLAGGVSMNQAVVKHFCNLLHVEPLIGEHSHLYGAIGAALLRMEEGMPEDFRLDRWEELISDEIHDKTYAYPPLCLKESSYPDFDSYEKYLYKPQSNFPAIEVDLYIPLQGVKEVYCGIDIGSTSTKAVLINDHNDVLISLYTSTTGQPVKAVQALCQCLDDIAIRKDCRFVFKGLGTTGSGRKFIGRIIGADMMVDEITAHARAAFELNSETDTIIEIGGQDSKFTTMKNGMVTSSIMNNVCAAGTGSFIEEQARKLSVPLAEYADRAMNIRAPIASDRCTVFMERDINNYLADGYTIDEVLASVLHAICENYLAKVAVEANIGDNVCFQGATARNRALVAAPEHRIKRPIFVSKFCHLTGALGAALILAENRLQTSTFRGLDLYREEIPVAQEVCELCHNHCKIRKVTVQGETVAFGFLCGRDYDTKHYIGPERRKYDLLREREKVFRTSKEPDTVKHRVTIGIPHALYLAEEMPLWKHFFHTLGVRTVTTENLKGAVKAGKKISGAEFCAPMQAFFAHVQELADKCDYVFMPTYLEAKEPDRDAFRYYCYSSQFAVSLALGLRSLNLRKRAITPVIEHRSFQSKIELFMLLRSILGSGYWEIYNAYESALAFYHDSQEHLHHVFEREKTTNGDFGVVLLGRPYTVLEPAMNKGIPDIFGNLGIKTFFQDMLPEHKEELAEIDPLLDRLHWNYAAKILKGALHTAKTDGLYPVYITSFKCSPDACILEYFRRIMDRHGKPYLILEIDEHDSSVGYETRIEAAIRSFRNHYRRRESRVVPLHSLPLNSECVSRIKGKTLLFPCIDHLNSKLVEAVLIREGIDARMVPLTEKTIQHGLRTNSGQCLPVNLIAQSYMDYIRENYLDPEHTAVWVFESHIPCNIRMYPQMIKNIFETAAKGMQRVDVYIGQLGLMDISITAAIEGYFAHMFGGMLRKIGCRIRPYEKEKGKTDAIVSQSLNIFYNTLLGGRSKDEDIARVVGLFRKIETTPVRRPQVAVFGDMYARDNDVFNQDLIHCIEEYGGEVITTPFNEFAKLIANPYIRRWFSEGFYRDALLTKSIVTLVNQVEKSYYKQFNELLDEPSPGMDFDYAEVLAAFHVKIQQFGESADNLIKIAALMRHYPDISLFVQTNPAFCCAGLVTEAMAPRIEAYTGIPVVTLTYDGTSRNINAKIRPYIKFPRKRAAGKVA
ncbi:MAG: CoA activase, partial [Acidobacteria bacterium]|nr:CoA activase [Acidobacteriota bacterium]